MLGLAAGCRGADSSRMIELESRLSVLKLLTMDRGQARLVLGVSRLACWNGLSAQPSEAWATVAVSHVYFLFVK